jgi:hypothetical protein
MKKGVLFGKETFLHAKLKTILINDNIELLDFDDFGANFNG